MRLILAETLRSVLTIKPINLKTNQMYQFKVLIAKTIASAAIIFTLIGSLALVEFLISL